MDSTYLKLIPLFPLLAFITNSLFLRTKANLKTSGIISLLGTAISFIYVCVLFSHFNTSQTIIAHLWDWAVFEDISFQVKFMADALTFVLLFMVTGIGSLITLFSIGYMDHDPRPGKFFSYLSLFIFSMLLLVLSENFLVLFFGWEGVGLCSYLLIGFWYDDIEKAKAGRKAFIANRVGDFGVILGIIGFALIFKTISFESFKTVDVAFVQNNLPLLTMAGLFIVLGVTGKSAQLPLFVWLPDAMAGPTPVSALIHAATMVTAGVYLMCRLSNVFVHLPVVMDVIAWIGAITAFVAAVMAVTQRDIKKVLAYSTVSQLGYMVLACGIGAFSAGIFHVFTHAFFKALLFLGAGAIIHSLHHEQDIFKMGGLKNKMPITFWCFVAALLAINGIPGFAGFFSKDEIIWLALNNQKYGLALYSLAFVTALMTAFYMTRLVVVVFLSKDKVNKEVHVHEAPVVMVAPLCILAFFSVTAGYFGLPHFMSHSNARMFQRFVETVVPAPAPAIFNEDVEHLLMALTIILILLSMALAYYLYKVKEDEKTAEKLKFLMLPAWKVSNKKFMIDEIYETAIYKPIVKFSEFLTNVIEKYVIDGFVKGGANLIFQGGVYLKLVRPQVLESNLLYMVIGLTLFMAFIYSSFSK